MDWFERRILETVLLWAPFGGVPDDEVLPRFGLTASEFRSRVEDILAAARPWTVQGIDNRVLVARVGALLKSKRALVASENCSPQHAHTAPGPDGVRARGA